MINAAIIGFREFFEMVLVLIPLIIYIKKQGEGKLSKYVVYGAVMGFAISILSGVFIYMKVLTLQVAMKEIFEGSMSIFLSALVLYNIVLLSFSKKSYGKNVEESYKFKNTAISLILLSFITVFRESLEIIVFLLPTMIINPFNVIFGICIGLVLSVISGFLIFKIGFRINITFIFTILNVTLIFIGGIAFGEGIEALSGYSSAATLGELLYIIPLLYLFLKGWLKKLIKR